MPQTGGSVAFQTSAPDVLATHQRNQASRSRLRGEIAAYERRTGLKMVGVAHQDGFLIVGAEPSERAGEGWVLDVERQILVPSGNPTGVKVREEIFSLEWKREPIPGLPVALPTSDDYAVFPSLEVEDGGVVVATYQGARELTIQDYRKYGLDTQVWKVVREPAVV